MSDSDGFTPGPWELAKDERGDWVIVARGMPPESPLARVSTLLGDDESFPDARLIAAAPELYEALKELLAWHQDPAGFTPELIADKVRFKKALEEAETRGSNAYIKARAALAKAGASRE